MTRDDLAELARGNAVELGVAAGDFSAVILARSRCDTLYSIDKWDDHHDENEMRKAVAKLARYGRRSVVLRSTFGQAAKKFAPEFFSFVYIDGYAHTGQDQGQTLHEWWPLLRQGGIFAGHDYDLKYQPTIDAVDRFAGLVDREIFLTDEAELKSWWMIK